MERKRLLHLFSFFLTFCFTCICTNNSLSGEPDASPVNPSLRFKSVTAGMILSCAITTDGIVYCWGGKFGATPIPVGESVSFVQVGIKGFEEIIGLSTDGSLYKLEKNRRYPKHLRGGGNNPWPEPFKLITIGSSHACALSRDGVGWCWGDNKQGQLGWSPGFKTFTGFASTEQRYKVISVGSSHTCGITIDGIAYCWGNNESGQLGDNSSKSSYEPQPAMPTNPNDPAQFRRYLEADREWTKHVKTIHRKVSTRTRFVTINARYNHTAAITTDGQV